MTAPRVLIFHPALAPYRVDMFNSLARRCDLRLILLSDNVPNQAFDQARLRAELVVPPRYLLRGFDVAGRTIRLGIGDAIRRFRPDVVVTTEFGQATLAVIARRRLDGGTYAHVVGTEDNPFSVRRETRLHGLGRRLLQPHVDCVLTYSEEARALYRDEFGATQPVAVSPLVQDERVLAARLAGAADTARTLAVKHGLFGKRLLLYVGRLAPEKRVDRLVDAVGRLHGEWPDLRLALVGDGAERVRLQARAAAVTSPGLVIFAGRCEGERLAAWYRLGVVFALASEHEPYGAVVNEALLAGLPVVCSDRAGARGLVTGRNGAVVDADRPEALDGALANWLGRQPQVSCGQLDAPRPSLMESTFADAVAAYLAALEAARQHLAGSRRRRAAA
jgi:glycosyltransferase involved in cell wall biosynthesis